MRDVNRASRLSMRELSATISARTSWRNSARPGRMALNRCGPPGRVVENGRSPLLCSAEASASGRTTTSLDATAGFAGAYLQTHRSIPRVLEDVGTRETRFWGPFCASFWRGSTRNSPRRHFGGSRVHRRARNCSLPRKAQGNEGDLRVELSFWPGQARGGPVSCSSHFHVDQGEVFGACPG